MKVGIDLGGTKTEAILIHENGEELFRKRIKTINNYEGTIQGIKNLIDEIKNQYKAIDSIGIGMPGIVSKYTSLVKNANSVWLNGKPLKKDLENYLNIKIEIENDANCFALSEAVDGAGKNYNVVFGVIIGTGTGGGLIFNKQIHQGVNQIGGEWGHTALPNRSEEEIKYSKNCFCGLKGCMETYVSGPGFSHLFNKKNNENFDSHQILEEFKHGSNRTKIALDNYVDHLARGLSNVINIIDPDVIVLGGGMSNIDYIYKNINSSLKKYVVSDTIHTKVIKNIHGDSSGVRGAAWL
tara:strand:+ start:255 stop:1142 length:888 start_codon:yes stop_codon:yes gene_type:complete